MNDSFVPASPAHNAINVALAPTFSWSRSGNPEFVELRLYEYDPVRSNYGKFIWDARVYGATFAITPPAMVTLKASTPYSYQLLGRRNLTTPTGVHAGFQRNGWESVKFSTGASLPP
jgi:hypothetical protein